MNVIIRKLSSFFIKNQHIKEEDRALYEYALKVFIQGFINIVITVLIGIFLNMIKECLCFFITFILLRKFSGGLHAKKYVNCLASSSIIILFSLLFIKYLEQNNNEILFICIVVVSIFIILLFSPLENKNKKLSAKEKKIFKYFTVLMTILFFVIVLVLLLNESFLTYSFGMGIILVSLLLIIGKLYNSIKI
ncbi:accessory gene regulator ArgB-like protein [uncultured Eubacterium sp.]|uniref:accessory gene regulator ArgB-like protein n=1 Tax=uncultured Eubacterium sp. TaxID=165185 RepID=UPI002584D76A|nr:accessory gene regulator B family protein [uncultured Eubacterium sp.]